MSKLGKRTTIIISNADVRNILIDRHGIARMTLHRAESKYNIPKRLQNKDQAETMTNLAMDLAVKIANAKELHVSWVTGSRDTIEARAQHFVDVHGGEIVR